MLMLDRGADVNLNEKMKGTPLLDAVTCKNTMIVERLLEEKHVVVNQYGYFH